MPSPLPEPDSAFARVSALLSATPVDGGLSYGTAGFRAAAGRLPGALLRVGALAALRSASRGGSAVGVMVTASHNPGTDNGAKVVDCEGGMLCGAWEAAAGRFVNGRDGAVALKGVLAEVGGVDEDEWAAAVVVVGGDTRESTRRLMAMVRQGVEAVRGCEGGVVELGVCTTPQLHYVVRGMWRGEACGMEDYYARLVREYRALSGGAVGVGGVIVDCANGVGGIAMAGVDGVFDGLVVVNRAGDGPLNAGCGADFVQKKRAMPAVFGGGGGGRKGAPIWASLDGDADRLVMYKEDPAGGGAVLLADGDRFSALTAMFLSRHMEAVGLGGVAIGVAQTAYSNGAATEYVAGLRGVEVVVAKTGVKHLEIAVNAFDVGIYWEPNGHGTVMYSEAFVRTLAAALDECGQGGDAARRASLNVLLSVGRLANQAVGDGVADLLLVLAMLAREGMSFEDWLGMYAERCSANLVVQVADKGVIATENCDRVVTAPAALRKAVDAACRGDGRRAFVRPSGTEDVVRVYAEAPAGCEAEAAGVALEIARAVHDTCAGVGGRP